MADDVGDDDPSDGNSDPADEIIETPDSESPATSDSCDSAPGTTGSAGRGSPASALMATGNSDVNWPLVVGWIIAIGCGVFVFFTVGGGLIFTDTTPTGGDMGAHVWGPEYLKTELLPNFRLTGWTPDWYAGFPSYVFYMVVPSLFIVWIDVGLPLFVGIPLALVLAFGAYTLYQRISTRLAKTVLIASTVFVAVLLIDVPYNIAFKVVAISGLVTLPIAAFVLARAAKIPFPGPPLLALGATFFLFEGGFSILGGNILSTMAGEFAFSISLTFAMLYLAVLFKGIETGRYRALGAILFSLVILNHLIPAIFAVVATVVIILVRREDRTPWWDASRVGRTIGVLQVALVGLVLWLVPGAFPIVATFVALSMLGGFDRRALRWSAVVLPVGGLVAAFWFLPFYLNSAFLNDMGWEKYTNYACYLWPQAAHFDMANRNLWFALAGAGMVLSLVHRVRVGWFFTLVLTAFGWAFVFLPQYRLWNARLLPFYYLSLYMLAAIAVALFIRSIALVVGDMKKADKAPDWVGITGAAVASIITAVYLLGSLQALPGGTIVQVPVEEGGTTSAFRWFSQGVGPWTLDVQFQDLNNANGWAVHNFNGLEGQDAYPEYVAMVDMMAEVGDTYGCGRVMWEYEQDLGRFGTPMAPMLLPYFTDGCMGSMEGLYFEASSTTPFHFINQSELSPQASSAQRDLPYPGFDMDAGVEHLRLMGIPYYLAATDQAVEAARGNDGLTELASTGPFTSTDGTERNWVVFEVEGAEPVVSAENLPVVLEPEGDHIDGWVYAEDREPVDENAVQGDPVNGCPAPDPAAPAKTAGPAMDWYLDPTKWDTRLATSGPDDWPRISREDAANAPSVPVDPVTISNFSETNDSISFTVSEPGTPVIVNTSYFPNWQVSGAEGPYRVSPNMMVVVPTETEVMLSYGTTKIDWLAWIMTILGVGLVAVLARADQRRRHAEASLLNVPNSYIMSNTIDAGTAALSRLGDTSDPSADDGNASEAGTDEAEVDRTDSGADDQGSSDQGSGEPGDRTPE